MSANSKAQKPVLADAQAKRCQLHEDLLEDPESFDHVVVRPNDNFQYLGGGERDHTFPLGETFEKLPRPSSLPPLSSIKNSNSPIGEKEDAILKCWNGDFAVKWKIDRDAEDDEHNFALVLFAYVDLASNEGEPACCFSIVAIISDQQCVYYCEPGDGIQASDLGSMDIDSYIVGARILHHFCRQHGAKLPPDVFGFARQELNRQYQQDGPKQHLEEILDVHVVSIDVAVTNQWSGNESWTYGAVHVGLQLLVMSRAEEAANFMVECHNHGKFDSKEEEIAFLHNGYQCLHISELFSERTESLCIQFIHLSFAVHTSDNPFENKSVEVAIMALLSGYLDRAAELVGDNRKLGEFKKAADRLQILIGLLFAAGFRPERKPVEIGEVFYEAANNQTHALNKKLRLRKHASMSFLKTAFAAPDVDSFWRMILAAGKPSMLKFLDYKQFKRSGSASVEVAECAKLSRRYMAKSLRDLARQNNLLTCCYHCGKSVPVETGCSSCPCKNAYYCSKDCQRADWPTHKKNCAWKQSQKATVTKSSFQTQA